jgi:hypothetical protein
MIVVIFVAKWMFAFAGTLGFIKLVGDYLEKKHD